MLLKQAKKKMMPKSGSTISKSQELFIPFKLDVNKPLPPPRNAPISAAYEWWLQRGAQRFPNVQLGGQHTTTTPTPTSASKPTVQTATQSAADQTASALNIVQTQVIPPRSHRFSMNRPQKRDRSKGVRA